MNVSYKKINYPNYQFSTKGIAPTIMTQKKLVRNGLINVVPTHIMLTQPTRV